MSIKNLTITMRCDLCEIEPVAKGEEEITCLQLEWYESILFDLCGECRNSEAGLKMIENGEILHDRVNEKFQKRKKPSFVRSIIGRLKNLLSKITKLRKV